MLGVVKLTETLLSLVLLASVAGCGSTGPSPADSGGSAVDHLLVRVVAVPAAEGSSVGRHRIEMRCVSGEGHVRADGATVRVGTGVGDAAPRGAIVADTLELDPTFTVVPAPDVVAADGEEAPMVGLRSRARPADRGAHGDAVFRELRGRVKVTSAVQGALDVTFDFRKEDVNPAAPPGAPPDVEHHQMTVRLGDGATALISTAMLGEVRLR